MLIQILGSQLSHIPELRVFLSDNLDIQSGVLSFEMINMDCERVGEWLSRHGVAVRAGLHCAPMAHRSAGTLDRGTIRASVSCYNTKEEIYQTVGCIHQLLNTQ